MMNQQNTEFFFQGRLNLSRRSTSHGLPYNMYVRNLCTNVQYFALCTRIRILLLIRMENYYVNRFAISVFIKKASFAISS